MSRMLPQRDCHKAARVAVTVPRDRFLKTFAGFIISSLVRWNIRRGNTNMDSIQSLLEEHLSIIPVDDQEHILLNFNQMQRVRESLNSHSLPPIILYKKAKTYDRTSTRVLEMVKDASDRARENDTVGRMARETGLTNFATDHPLRRVHSIDSDWSDCTLPTEPVNPDSHLSTDTGEEDNYSRSESPSTTRIDVESISSRPESQAQAHLHTSELWSTGSDAS